MEDATVYETNFNRIYNYSPYYSIVDFVNTEIYEDTSCLSADAQRPRDGHRLYRAGQPDR